MIVKLENIEVRGCEVKESKKDGSKYMIVRFEDETGKSHEIIDRDMDNQQYYKRGTVGDIYADLDIGRNFTKFQVSRFQGFQEGKA